MARKSESALFDDNVEEKLDYVEFIFEDGHWAWDDINDGLKFIR